MSSENTRVRVLLAKPGLDGHDSGIYLVAQALRNSGMEVVFLGLQVTPNQIVEAAIQESVDLIGLSIFSSGYMTLIPKIINAPKDKGLGDIPIIVGGIIPPGDAAELKKNGVSEIFPPGCATSKIVSCVRSFAKHEQFGKSRSSWAYRVLSLLKSDEHACKAMIWR